MKAAVLLSGCGIQDGSDLQESVLSILHLSKAGYEVSCFAPWMEQHHVVDHRTGSEVAEFRNVLAESSRIAPGRVAPISDLEEFDFDCLVIPGGLGVSKNLTKWSILGPVAGIHPAVRDAIRAFVANRRPVMGLSMAATTIAKAVQALECSPKLTIGLRDRPSSFPVAEIAAGLEATGARIADCAADEPCVDEDNRIVTVACTAMDADIVAIERGIEAGVRALVRLSDAAAVSRFTASSEVQRATTLAPRPHPTI